MLVKAMCCGPRPGPATMCRASPSFAERCDQGGPPWADMGGISWQGDRFAEYRDTGPRAGTASSDRPQLTDSQAAGQETVDWLGAWTPTAS